MTTTPTVTVSRLPALPSVAVVTLSRPQRLNAMNPEMVDDLHRTLDELAPDTATRVVILTGSGTGFCSGLDVKEIGRFDVDASPAVQLASQQRLSDLVRKLRHLPQPVITAVNGPAAGGGFALALASDIRIGTPTARFSAAFVRIGLSGCDLGVSWLLPRLVGASRAAEIMLTGRLVDADEALRAGILLEVVEADELMGRAGEIAARIVANSPLGVQLTKEVMWANLEVASLDAGIALENKTQVLARFGKDMHEAVDAFVERRPAEFTGQ